MSNLDDTDEFALRGQLGRCSEGVKRLFRDLDQRLRTSDGVVTARALHKGTDWLGRSYRDADGRLCEMHPKIEYIMVRVREADFLSAPKSMVAPVTRANWLRIYPSDADPALRYIAEIRP